MKANITFQVEKPLLSIKEYAKLVGDSEKTVRDDVASGLLPFVQLTPRSKIQINMTALLVMTLEAEEKKAPHNRANW